MIPTIETIVDDLVNGTITKQQAISWLYAHAEGTANDLRDHFAAQAMIGWRESEVPTYAQEAKVAYKMADAMMLARNE